MMQCLILQTDAFIDDFARGAIDASGIKDTDVGRAVGEVADRFFEAKDRASEFVYDAGYNAYESVRDTVSMGLSEIGRGQDFDAPDYGGGWSSTLTGGVVDHDDK